MIENGTLQRFNAESFTYYNYNSNWWSYFDITYGDSLTPEKWIDKVRDSAVGFCDSSRLTVRPKEGVALMVQPEDEPFWFHVTQDLFDKLFPKDITVNLESYNK